MVTFGALWPQIDETIFGWLTEAEALRLYNLAHTVPPGTAIVELGAFMGRSTAALAAGALHSNRQTRVISIDTWQGSGEPEAEKICRQKMAEHGVDDLFALHRKNLEALGLGSVTRRIRARTVPEGIEWAKEWEVPIGLLFIDADHVYESVKQDFEAFAPLVVPGGVVAFHDSWADGPSRVIGERDSDLYRRLVDADAVASFAKSALFSKEL